MSFGESLKTVFRSKYATFSGRARRSEYWWAYLGVFLVSLVLNIPLQGVLLGAADTTTGEISSVPPAAIVLYILMIVFGLAILVPMLAVIVRRLHDTGRSGWWYFIALVPFVGGLILLFFMIQDSQAGDNAYGPNPKA